jgi:type II secretion system protein N
VPELSEFLSAEFWRTHVRETSYAAAGLVLFVFFLTATFPYTEALSAYLQPLGLGFTSAGQSFNFFLGTRLDDVRITDVDAPKGVPVVQSRSVSIAPALGSMLLLRPGVKVGAEIYGGTVALRVHRSGDGTAVRFDATALNLATATFLREIGAAFGGALSASGEITVMPGEPNADTGTVALIARAFTIRIVSGMPPIKLGDTTARIRLEHGAVQVEDLRSTGGDVAVSGRGTIQLAPDWRQSRLALQLNLVPAASARARLGFMLNLLPHPPDGRPYTLSGTLASPVII